MCVFKTTNYQLKIQLTMKIKLSIYRFSKHIFYLLLSAVVHFFKVRYYAKPFDIWKEKQDNNRVRDDWFGGDYISYDGKLYYGDPWFIFFESAQNEWWLSNNSR